jgi:hypothetical protein
VQVLATWTVSFLNLFHLYYVFVLNIFFTL